MNFWSWVNLFPSFYRDKHAHNHPTIYHYLWWITGGAWNDLLYSKKKAGTPSPKLVHNCSGERFPHIEQDQLFLFSKLPSYHLQPSVYALFLQRMCTVHMHIFYNDIVHIRISKTMYTTTIIIHYYNHTITINNHSITISSTITIYDTISRCIL